MGRTVALKVSIQQARGLISSKGTEISVSSCVSITLPGTDELVESDVKEQTHEPIFAFERQVQFTASDEALTVLLTTPMLVTVLEMPERIPLGTLKIDWTPLLQEATVEQAWLRLESPEGSEMAGELLVGVTASAPLLSQDEFEESTMLEMSIVSMHALPPKWIEGAVDESHPFNYVVNVEFPLLEGTQPPAFAGGQLVAPNREQSTAPIEMSDPSRELDQTHLETAAFRIEWSRATVRRFLGPKARDALHTALDAGKPLALLKLTRVVKNPESFIDTNARKYAALVESCPTSLLEVEVLSSEITARVVPDPDPTEVEPLAELGGKSKGKGPDVLPAEDEEDVHPFLASGTCLKLQYNLSRPMVPRPPTPAPPSPKVADLIPKRVLPQFAAKTAAKEFQGQIASLVETLVAEWSSVFPELDLSKPSIEADREERRKMLLYKLNSEGKYWMYKERLKRCIVRIVKEIMSRPTAEPLDSQGMQIFFNNLYVALTQQLHTALNQIFIPASRTPNAPSAPDQLDGEGVKDVLKVLAMEMEVLFRFEKAATYHHERVASCKYDATVWYDYALFLMRTGNSAQAEECTKEAIALQPGEFEYLFGHGCVLATRGNFSDAEVFLRESLELMPHDVELWLLMGILYSKMGRGRDVRQALKQAKQVERSDNFSERYYHLAVRCLKLNAHPLIEASLHASSELEGRDGDNHHIPLCRGKMLLTRGLLDEAAVALDTALSVSNRSVSGWTLLGQVRLLQGRKEEAKIIFSKALDLCGQPPPLSALLHLGQLCLDSDENTRAKELFLLACRQQPSCTAWLGVGTACYELAQYAESEEAFAEANVLNNRDELVWGRLALLCTNQQRFEEANQALKQAFKLGLDDVILLHSLGEMFVSFGKWVDGECCLRRALEISEQAQTLALLADCLYEQNMGEEAIQMYERTIQSLQVHSGQSDAVAHCERRIGELKVRNR